jgi:hypothetical protein
VRKDREIRLRVTEATWQKWHEIVYREKYVMGTAKSEETVFLRAIDALETSLLKKG